MTWRTASVLLFVLVVQVICQNDQGQQQSNQPQQSQQNQQNQPGQQGNRPLGNWASFGQDQQWNPTGGVQAMVTPVLHAGAAISHTAFELGKGFLRWPMNAMGDIQAGITGFINSFANPIWVAPTRRPYDQTLGELLSQFPPQTTTTQKPSTTSKPNQNQNQNRPNNQG